MSEQDYWNQMYANAVDQSAPAVLWRPRLFIDGNQWCALYGDNIQDGVAGFGDTPDKAMRNFDHKFLHQQVGRRNRMSEQEELLEWPCQHLLGGTGSGIRDNVDGLCKHHECHPRNDKNGPLTQEEIDIKNIEQVLHVLRNPHGWNDHIVRNARLVAADTIEQQAADLEVLRGFTLSLVKVAQTTLPGNYVYVALRKHKLIDKNGKPTALLTGETE